MERFCIKTGTRINEGSLYAVCSTRGELACSKGEYSFHKQIHNQATRVNRVYCQYEEFSAENQLNYILKCAIERLMNNVTQLETLKKLKRCLVYFDELVFSTITKMDFSTVHFNRLNKRFEPSFILAKMILENMFSLSHFEKRKVFQFYFEWMICLRSILLSC